MAGERPSVVTEEYERLGGKKLSLVDVLAQSVGFMGPVFSAAFIIPLIIGVNAAGRGRGNLAPRSPCSSRRWGSSRSAGSSPSTRGGSMPPVRCTTTSRTGSARRSGRDRWFYYGGTIILTTGLGRAVRRVRARQPVARPGDRHRPADLAVGLDLRASVLFAVLYFGVQISTRVQLTLALISIAVVLIFFITVIVDLGSDNDIAKAFDPLASPAGSAGSCSESCTGS